MTIDLLKREVLDIRIFCGRYFPFIVIPLSYIKIIVSKQVSTAGVNEKGIIIINPVWWSTLNTEAKRFVIIHECLHAVLCHPFRAHQYNPVTYNVCADGKVNHAITEAHLQGVNYQGKDIVTLHSLATLTKLRVDDLQMMSTEELVKSVENSISSSNQTGSIANLGKACGGFGGGDLLRGDFEGDVLQEGEPTLNASSSSSEVFVDAWRGVCEKAKVFAKQAGTLPASFERLVDEVLEVKPPWQSVLRFGLRSGFVCDSSFAYPNRRSNDLPGCVGYSGAVWCLVDTSGSISQEMLQQFLGIVKYEARYASLRVMSWDAAVYEVLKAERPCDVRRIASKLKGGGGTTCLPVLQKVYKLMTPGDVVVILTDGDIFDAETPETRKMFSKIANKAGFKLLGYTQKPLKPPGFSSAYITL